MKHLFLSMAAVAMLASCSSDEIIDKAQEQKTPISFKTPFVDNMTRITTSKASDLWGWQAETQIFNAEDVAADGTYTNTAYWLPSTQYEFVALAPQGVTNVTASKATGNNTGKIEIADYTNDGDKDLMFATASITSQATASDNTAVGLTFQHMLSKVKFTFVNAFASDVNTIKVSGITMSKFNTVGDLTAQGTTYTWSNLETEGTKTFTGVDGFTGSWSTDEYLLIPTTTALTIAFTTELFSGGVSIGSKQHSINLTTAELGTGGLLPGHSYEFTATLTADNVTTDGVTSITFTVQDGGWTPGMGTAILQ